jgi:hypothetical protein
MKMYIIYFFSDVKIIRVKLLRQLWDKSVFLNIRPKAARLKGSLCAGEVGLMERNGSS